MAVALGGLFTGPAAAGVVLSFTSITNNSATDADIGEAQLAVEVSAVGTTQVSFLFTNVGAEASAITDVYFDDGTLLGIASITGIAGVDFSSPATPANLPGGNTIGFVTTAGFSADADNPQPSNGVNPGESLTIVFDLINGKTYADTIAALDLEGEGSLRIGIKLQAFVSGGSEGFVNNPPDDGGLPPAQTPEPGSLVLLGLGLAGLALVRRRRYSS